VTTLQFADLAKFAAHLGLVAAEMHYVGMTILLEAAVAVRDEAQAAIGHLIMVALRNVAPEDMPESLQYSLPYAFSELVKAWLLRKPS
jgi:NO-binding membrane sensor protein with MHYT domain